MARFWDDSTRSIGPGREAEISRQIVERYTRVPREGDDLEDWRRQAGRDLIAEEPW